MELETNLIIARELHYLEGEAFDQTVQRIEGIGKMLNRLVGSLKSRQL